MRPTTTSEPPALPWGALTKWRREIGNTPSARWDVTDPLYRLACIESNARDEHRAGLHAHLRESWEKYERIVVTSVADDAEAA